MIAFARGKRKSAAPLFEGAAHAHALLTLPLNALPSVDQDHAYAQELSDFPVAWAEVQAAVTADEDEEYEFIDLPDFMNPWMKNPLGEL
jgi:hypothetical protein